MTQRHDPATPPQYCSTARRAPTVIPKTHSNSHANPCKGPPILRLRPVSLHSAAAFRRPPSVLRTSYACPTTPVHTPVHNALSFTRALVRWCGACQDCGQPPGRTLQSSTTMSHSLSVPCVLPRGAPTNYFAAAGAVRRIPAAQKEKSCSPNPPIGLMTTYVRCVILNTFRSKCIDEVWAFRHSK